MAKKKPDTPAEAAVRTALAKYIGITVPGENGHTDFSLPEDAIYQEHYYTPHGARHVHFVLLQDFARLFGTGLTGGDKVSHAALIAVDPDDEMGHHKYLDKWHDEGLI